MTRSCRNMIAACLTLTLATTALGQGKIEKAKLGATRNVHVCGKLFLAGQPQEDDVDTIAKRGIKSVITLRLDDEVNWDEAKAFKDAGVAFEAIPIGSSADLDDKVFDRVRKVLKGSDQNATLLHCGSANRVGAVWLVFRVLDQGVDLETALGEAKTIGMRTPAFRDKAVAYIKKRMGKKSVRPGINERFLDPNLKMGEWLQRFEGESREIYASRNEILDAIKLKPGMSVADIGAGTGFFSAMFSRKAGPEGWVFAVDISPKFIGHISEMAAKQKLNNLTPVLGAGDSVRLQSNSVDLVFICDTYHHFEYPATTLGSIHRAMRNGGSLVVIDFHRIPGKSREFIMNHVRADQQTFRKEIEAAGFQFVEEVKVPGLRENYMLRFRKK